MRKKLLGLLFGFLVLFVLSYFGVLKNLTGSMERLIVVPVRQLYKTPEPEARESIKVLSLKEELIQLKKENQIFREQLGAIPDKANLYPASVIWQLENQLILNYPYETSKELLGHPVVWGKVYLGRISRIGSRLLVVDKPFSSGFTQRGESGQGTAGWIKGRFNEQVVFETAAKNQLAVGDMIYLLDPDHAWRLLVGEVYKIENDKRLPTKQGIINFLPAQAKLETVFIVI